MLTGIFPTKFSDHARRCTKRTPQLASSTDILVTGRKNNLLFPSLHSWDPYLSSRHSTRSSNLCQVTSGITVKISVLIRSIVEKKNGKVISTSYSKYIVDNNFLSKLF